MGQLTGRPGQLAYAQNDSGRSPNRVRAAGVTPYTGVYKFHLGDGHCCRSPSTFSTSSKSDWNRRGFTLVGHRAQPGAARPSRSRQCHNM